MDQRPAPGYHVDDDDQPVGRMLSRREALVLLGGVGASVAVVTMAPSVLAQSPSAPPTAGARGVRPPLLRHPARADRGAVLRGGRAGTLGHPGRQRGRQHASRGASRPRPGWCPGSTAPAACRSRVRSWTSGTATRAGVYSGVTDPSFDTTGHDYLRGVQRTDATGAATFTTIYPGWYQGRTVHVHFKVRTDPDASTGTELTSQLFFDDTFTDGGVPGRAVCQQGHPDAAQRRRRHLPAERRPDARDRDPGSRRVRGHVPDRHPAQLNEPDIRPGGHSGGWSPVMTRRSRSAPEAMPPPTMRAERLTPVTVSAGPRTISLTEPESSRTATMVASASVARRSKVARRAGALAGQLVHARGRPLDGRERRRHLLAQHLDQAVGLVRGPAGLRREADEGPRDDGDRDRDDDHRHRGHQPEEVLLHRPTVPQSGSRSGMMLARLTTTRMPTHASTVAQTQAEVADLDRVADPPAHGLADVGADDGRWHDRDEVRPDHPPEHARRGSC